MGQERDEIRALLSPRIGEWTKMSTPRILPRSASGKPWREPARQKWNMAMVAREGIQSFSVPAAGLFHSRISLGELHLHD